MAGCVGICCALSAEARTLTNRRVDPGQLVELNSQTLLVLSGMGAQRASNAAQRLLDEGVSALVSWGVAAALDKSLLPGTLILPQVVLSVGSERLPVQHAWHNALRRALTPILDFHTGTLVETHEILTDERRKLELSQPHNAIAADMETVAIAQIALRSGIAFSAIRAISDTVSMTVPQALVNAVKPVGQLSTRAMLTTVILRPRDWYRIIKLGMGMRAACITLRKAYACTATDLCHFATLAEKSRLQGNDRN